VSEHAVPQAQKIFAPQVMRRTDTLQRRATNQVEPPASPERLFDVVSSDLMEPRFGHDFSRATVRSPYLAGQQHTKAEAAYNAPEPEDDEKKIEDSTGTGALIGGGTGAGLGALIGGLVGGPLGALVGFAIGGLVGAGIGALVGSLVGGPGITWKPANYASDNSNSASTTVEQPFNVQYRAIRDEADSIWRLQAASIEGGADIHVRTGGSRNPITSPPATEAEAQNAVTVMKGYYARGKRGAWHTEAASRAHEEHHYREWKCASEHYWPTAKASIESLTAPLDAHPNESAAIAAMRSGSNGADAKVQSFRDIAHQYWFTLADNASSRPYAAGQLVLNQAITHVQDLAASQSWTVPQGTDSPSSEPPCYQPWLPYTP
jgi:predicted lipid-binding transport protein (Tim44 family)